MNPITVTVLFYASKELFDLTIEDVFEGERNEQHVLTQEGGIMFRTEKGKKWFLKFSEFAFVFEATQPSNEPQAQAVA